MSYDITVGKMDRNYTSNVSKMWDQAMPGLNLRDMNGKTAAECLPHLTEGVRHMANNFHSYREMEPSNGWGNAGGALSVLTQMMFECQENPNDIVHVYC